MLYGAMKSYKTKAFLARPVSIFQRPLKLKAINYSNNIAIIANKKKAYKTIMMVTRIFLEAYKAINLRKYDRNVFTKRRLIRAKLYDKRETKRLGNSQNNVYISIKFFNEQN